MSISPTLRTLATYLAGEFDNREQAIADPAWYVHLRLWQRPVPQPLFGENSLVLFAEQASVVNLEQAYRPRLMELKAITDPGEAGDRPPEFVVQYYMLEDPGAYRGAGRHPKLLETLTPSALERLPGCKLTVTRRSRADGSDEFSAVLPESSRCCFSYEGQTRQVHLGFDVSADRLLSHDKGIDPETGKPLWGALLGPFEFRKLQDFARELTP